jgi:hypothetical protein
MASRPISADIVHETAEKRYSFPRTKDRRSADPGSSPAGKGPGYLRTADSGEPNYGAATESCPVLIARPASRPGRPSPSGHSILRCIIRSGIILRPVSGPIGHQARSATVLAAIATTKCQRRLCSLAWMAASIYPGLRAGAARTTGKMAFGNHPVGVEYSQRSRTIDRNDRDRMLLILKLLR